MQVPTTALLPKETNLCCYKDELIVYEFYLVALGLTYLLKMPSSEASRVMVEDVRFDSAAAARHRGTGLAAGEWRGRRPPPTVRLAPPVPTANVISRHSPTTEVL